MKLLYICMFNILRLVGLHRIFFGCFLLVPINIFVSWLHEKVSIWKCFIFPTKLDFSNFAGLSPMKKGEKYNQYLHLDNQQQRIEQAAIAKARL